MRDEKNKQDENQEHVRDETSYPIPKDGEQVHAWLGEGRRSALLDMGGLEVHASSEGMFSALMDLLTAYNADIAVVLLEEETPHLTHGERCGLVLALHSSLHDMIVQILEQGVFALMQKRLAEGDPEGVLAEIKRKAN